MDHERPGVTLSNMTHFMINVIYKCRPRYNNTEPVKRLFVSVSKRKKKRNCSEMKAQIITYIINHLEKREIVEDKRQSIECIYT